MRKPPRPARAVLLDFDGVLAATIEDNSRAWIAALREHGTEIQPHDYLRLEGMAPLEIAARLCAAGGLSPETAPDVVALKEKLYARDNAFRFYPEMPGIVETLSRRGVCVALVSGCSTERLHRTVGPEFLRLFKSVTTADSGTSAKPDPAPYLDAIQRCGVPAQSCVAVENAPLGIRSAIAAGAWCIGITSTVTADDLREADEIVASHGELRERLYELCEGG